jgi:hypothetical protein
MKGLSTYLWRSGATGLLNTVASALSVGVLLPFIIHRAGLEAYGFFSMLAVFVGIAALLELGMSKALIFLGPRNPAGLSEAFCAALLHCAVGCAAFVALTFGLLASGVAVFGAAVEAQGDLKWWLGSCGCVLVLCNVATALLRGAFEGSYKMDVVNIGFAILTCLQYGAVFLTTLISQDPRHLLTAATAVFVVMLVGHIGLARRLLGLSWQPPQRATLQLVRKVGIASFAADAPGTLQAPALQYFFALAARTGSEYGVFDLALRLSTLCATALSSLSTPFFAVVAGAADAAAGSVRRAIAKHVRWMLALAALGCGAYWLIGRYVLELWIPSAPAELVNATGIILGGAALLAALEPWARMQLGIGNQKQLATTRLVALTVAIAVALLPTSLLLVEQFAWASVCGSLCASAGLAVLHMRENWGRH